MTTGITTDVGCCHMQETYLSVQVISFGELAEFSPFLPVFY
jgi:hypothetical protein